MGQRQRKTGYGVVTFIQVAAGNLIIGGSLGTIMVGPRGNRCITTIIGNTHPQIIEDRLWPALTSVTVSDTTTKWSLNIDGGKPIRGSILSGGRFELEGAPIR